MSDLIQEQSAHIKKIQEDSKLILIDDSSTDAEMICVSYCNNDFASTLLHSLEDLANECSYPQTISSEVSSSYNYELSQPSELVSTIMQIKEDFDQQ